MKNSSLIGFALLVLFGWTALAAGVLASLAGHPDVSMRPHPHLERRRAVPPPAPLLSDAPCQPQWSVAPCSA